jgi:hypothetical protein
VIRLNTIGSVIRLSVGSTCKMLVNFDCYDATVNAKRRRVHCNVTRLSQMLMYDMAK